MYGPLSFKGMIALKLIKRVGSKAVPKTFEAFAAECSVAIPISYQVIPLIPESFGISLARKFRIAWTTSLCDQFLGYNLSKQLDSLKWSF